MWFVTGAGGQLGAALVRDLEARAIPAIGLGRDELDITDESAVAAALEEHRPDVVVNCAAYTDVDAAEADWDRARAVNGDGPRVLAQALAGLSNAPTLVQISTDYVFDGRADEPYGEDAPTSPTSAYGRSKLLGELAVRGTLPDSSYVVRTAWLYGQGSRNFVTTMLGRAQAGEESRVVDDQVGQPTWTCALATSVIQLVLAQAPAGTYHGTSAGQASWFELAREVYDLAGADPALVTPMPSSELDRPAPRPAYSVLGHERWHAAGLAPMRDWREALHECLGAER